MSLLSKFSEWNPLNVAKSTFFKIFSGDATEKAKDQVQVQAVFMRIMYEHRQQSNGSVFRMGVKVSLKMCAYSDIEERRLGVCSMHCDVKKQH